MSKRMRGHTNTARFSMAIKRLYENPNVFSKRYFRICTLNTRAVCFGPGGGAVPQRQAPLSIGACPQRHCRSLSTWHGKQTESLGLSLSELAAAIERDENPILNSRKPCTIESGSPR